MALVAVLVVGVLAAGFLRMSSAITGHQTESIDRRRAFYLAEAGLAEAFSGVMFGKSGNVGSMDEPAVFGDGLFWVEATSLDDDMVELVSTGMCGSGRFSLALVVERGATGVASLGVFSNSDLVVPEGTLVDAYDSSEGGYGAEQGEGNGRANGNSQAPGQIKKQHAGRIGSNGSISVNDSELQPTEIHGDVVYGPQASVTFVGEPLITGVVERGYEIELPKVDVPGVRMEDGILHDNGMPLVIRPGEFGYEFLDVGPESDLIIEGPCSLVLEELWVRSGGSLTFDTSEGEVKLYVEKTLELSEGSMLSTTSTDPEDTYLYVSGDCNALLHAEGQFHGQIFGPEALLSVGPDFELFGAIVADGLSLAPGTKLHFDQFLTMLADEEAVPRFVTWRIVEYRGPHVGRGRDPFKTLGVDRRALPSPGDAHEDQWLEISYYDKLGVLKSYTGMESQFDWTDVDTIVGGWRGGGFASLTGTSGTLLVK